MQSNLNVNFLENCDVTRGFESPGFSLLESVFSLFCKLQEQFPRVWDNFAPTPGV